MNSSKSEIENALLDVRKAYRLLHDYQRMALDAVDYIAKELGMNYKGTYLKFAGAAPRKGGDVKDIPAWANLGMMFCEFHFRREFGDEWVGMSILLISDSGYFCAENRSLDRARVLDFVPPEQSSSYVGFLITANNWPSMGFLKKKAAMKTFIESGGRLPVEIRATGMIGKCCKFSDLASEAATTAIIDNLVIEAKRARIKLRRAPGVD